MSWILIATDGSDQAGAAAKLVASIAWPPGTSFGVVSVVTPALDLIGLAATPVQPLNVEDLEADERARLQAATSSAVDVLRAAGLKANGKVMRGRPAEVLVRLADRWSADLIVLGSRGLGTFRAALLGSVSAEVIDRAPCPVLVARSKRLESTVLADDGSPEAEAARRFLLSRPYLRGTETHLVSVVPPETLWPDSLARLDPHTADMLLESQRAVRNELAARLAADVAELIDAGIPATCEVRDGDPAHELVTAAEQYKSGMIVVGTHGRRGMKRLALGSVSRAVVHGAPCSVLVVRSTAAHATASVTGVSPSEERSGPSAPRSLPSFPVPMP